MAFCHLFFEPFLDSVEQLSIISLHGAVNLVANTSFNDHDKTSCTYLTTMAQLLKV